MGNTTSVHSLYPFGQRRCWGLLLFFWQVAQCTILLLSLSEPITYLRRNTTLKNKTKRHINDSSQFPISQPLFFVVFRWIWYSLTLKFRCASWQTTCPVGRAVRRRVRSSAPAAWCLESSSKWRSWSSDQSSTACHASRSSCRLATRRSVCLECQHACTAWARRAAGRRTAREGTTRSARVGRGPSALRRRTGRRWTHRRPVTSCIPTRTPYTPYTVHNSPDLFHKLQFAQASPHRRQYSLIFSCFHTCLALLSVS